MSFRLGSLVLLPASSQAFAELAPLKIGLLMAFTGLGTILGHDADNGIAIVVQSGDTIAGRRVVIHSALHARISLSEAPMVKQLGQTIMLANDKSESLTRVGPGIRYD